MFTSDVPLRKLALGAGLALTLGAAGCGGSDSGDAGADPAAVLPTAAPVYFEVKVRPDGDLKADVEAVAKKVLKTSDPGGEIVKALDKALKDDDGTNFKDDIDPWLGDTAGVAITSLRNPEDPDFAVAIASKDNDKAFASIKGDGKDSTEAEYDGVKYLKDKDDEDFVAGTVADTLVIGTEAGFKATVDAEKGSSQLDDAQAFKSARADVTQEDAIGFLYVDLAKALTAVSASQPLIAAQVEPLKKLLGGATSITAAIAVEDDVIRVEASQRGGPAPKAAGSPSQALADLPADTVLGAGLGEIGTALEQGLTQLSSIGPVGGQDPQALLSGLESSIGISVKDDLLSWMGEGAIFVQGQSLLDLGGGLRVTSKDPATTRSALKKIAPLVERYAGVTVGKAPTGADVGFSVPLGEGVPFELLVGLKGDTFVVGVNPAVVRAALDGSGTGRLGDAAAFKTAAGKLGDGIQPSFFLDFPKVVQFLGVAAGSDESFAQALPYLEAFSAIVAGGKRQGDVNLSRFAIGVK